MKCLGMHLKAVFALLFGLMTCAAQASEWPQKPIRLVVSFAAGGLTDNVARVLADGLSKELKQPVIVENRPGATGLIGTQFVANADPDGYTFLINPISTVVSPHVFKNFPASTIDRFAPVSEVSSFTKVLIVNNALPVKTVAELIDYVKQSKDPLSFGSVGVGSLHHLAAELFLRRSNIQMTHVPYRGSAPALVDLIGNQINLIMEDLPSALPYINSGQVRVLAVTSAHRSALLPDVPTMAESGMSDLIVEPWNGVVAPVQTPHHIVAAMDQAVGKVVKSDEFSKRVEPLGVVPTYRGLADYGNFMREEYERWGDVVQRAGIPKQ